MTVNMSTEGSIPSMNEPEGFFRAELASHERIRSVQSQIRRAIQNHHLLYTRAQAFPKDADLENHMKILQDLILSLGRTQLELMYQFKMEIKEKYGLANLHNVMAMYLGWPDRHEMFKSKENGATDIDKNRAQIVKKKPHLPQSARPKVKMQSLLKVNVNKGILPTRKESERLKAVATKQFESPTSVINSAKKLQSVLKARNEKLSQALVDLARRSSDDKPGDADNEIKDSLSSGSLKIEDTATSIKDVTQDSFLGLFGLIHKDKSKNMVVTQKKRKRRSAAGQSNFYGDFSYFQAKRTYTKRAVAPSSVPESPCSSQDVVEADENDGLSLTSTDKPSEPASPEIPSSQDIGDSQETATPQEPRADPVEGNNSEEIVEPVKSNLADETKMADDENSDGKTEALTPDSEEMMQSSGETGKDVIPPKDAMETETSIQTLDKDSTFSQANKKESEDSGAGLSNEDQTDGQTDSEEQSVGKLIADDSEVNEVNMETSEAEILLRYSPETDTVEMLPSADAQFIDQKPASPRSDDGSNDADPTSFVPDDESQNPRPSHPSKSSDACSVCFESSDAEIEKCSMCGENYHKECVPSPGIACPSCNTTPSSISSIVGVNMASRLTSTDCSEVIKRYLDDNQEEIKDSVDIRDSDRSKDDANVNDFTDDKNDADIIDSTLNVDHDELNDSNDVADLIDSAEDQDTTDINDCTEDQDDSLNPGVILLEDDDSLVFPNSSLYDEDNSSTSSQL